LFLFAVGVSGLLNKGGFVGVLIEKFLTFANTRRRLMSMSSPVVFVSVGLGASFSFSAVMSGTLLRPAYKKMGLKSQNLSRTIEDSGTVYDAFYPWSGGGIFAAGALGVATLEYMPFMFFAFLSTAFGLLVSLTQFKVETLPKDEADERADTTDNLTREK
ncbi:MAG: Na+/H+ antiporter NhaC family protein, partial [Mycobacteriaceae bacterium]